MLKHNDFANYKLAVILNKNNSFKEYAGKYYNYYYKNETDIIPAEESLCLECNYPAPNIHFVRKWLWEKHNIYLDIKYSDNYVEDLNNSIIEIVETLN